LRDLVSSERAKLDPGADRLSQQVVHHLAVHIGQAKLAALIGKSQPLVV
jgi:hypothetical protein